MARNDDRAKARRAKRQGGDSEADATEPTGAAPSEGSPSDALTPAVSGKEHAENQARTELTGSPVDLTEENVEASDAFDEQSDFVPAPGGVTLGGEVTTGGGNRIFRFFRASWAELQRVRWPDRAQVAQGTAVTLGFVIIAGAYLGLADVVARQIVDLII